MPQGVFGRFVMFENAIPDKTLNQVRKCIENTMSVEIVLT